MNVSALKAIALAGVLAQLGACQPAAQPPELLKQQHKALKQANQLGTQMQQQLDNRLEASDGPRD
jgi:hypothetical protein